MNKSDFIEAIAKDAKLTKADAGRAVDAMIDVITATVAKKQEVQLIGFGTFSSAKRAARAGKNPATGASIKIPATTVPKFKPGAKFKAAVAKKK